MLVDIVKLVACVIKQGIYLPCAGYFGNMSRWRPRRCNNFARFLVFWLLHFQTVKR